MPLERYRYSQWALLFAPYHAERPSICWVFIIDDKLVISIMNKEVRGILDIPMQYLERSVGHQCLVQMCEGRRCFRICCQPWVLCRRYMTRRSAALPLLRSIYAQLSLRKQDHLYSPAGICLWLIRERNPGSPSPPGPLQLQFWACRRFGDTSRIPCAPPWQHSGAFGTDTQPQVTARTQQGGGIALALPQPFEMQHR